LIGQARYQETSQHTHFPALQAIFKYNSRSILGKDVSIFTT